jgi:hypothetical protein
MPPAEFETTVSAGERPQTYALDRAATGIGTISIMPLKLRTNKPPVYDLYQRTLFILYLSLYAVGTNDLLQLELILRPNRPYIFLLTATVHRSKLNWGVENSRCLAFLHTTSFPKLRQCSSSVSKWGIPILMGPQSQVYQMTDISGGDIACVIAKNSAREYSGKMNVIDPFEITFKEG